MRSRTAPGAVRSISVHKAGLFSWRSRARRFAGSPARWLAWWLGAEVPRWPAGPPAKWQWQRPRVWIFAGPRDPSTKPSRGWLRVGGSKPRLHLTTPDPTRNKVTAKERTGDRGCRYTTPDGIFLAREHGNLCERNLLCGFVSLIEAGLGVALVF